MSTQVFSKVRPVQQFSTGYEIAFAKRVAQLGCKFRFPNNGYTNYALTYVPDAKAGEVLEFIHQTWGMNVDGIKVVFAEEKRSKYGTVIINLPARLFYQCPSLKDALSEYVPVKGDEVRQYPQLDTQMPVTEYSYEEPQLALPPADMTETNKAETLNTLRSMSRSQLFSKAQEYGWSQRWNKSKKTDLIEFLMN